MVWSEGHLRPLWKPAADHVLFEWKRSLAFLFSGEQQRGQSNVVSPCLVSFPPPSLAAAVQKAGDSSAKSSSFGSRSDLGQVTPSLLASLPLASFHSAFFLVPYDFPSNNPQQGNLAPHPLQSPPRCLRSPDVLLNLPAPLPRPGEEEQQIGIVMALLIALWVSNAICPHEDHPSEQSPSPGPCHPSHVSQAAHSSLPRTSMETGLDR